MATIKITKGNLSKLSKPSDKPTFYFDTETKGFGVKVNPTGRITYILDKRINGQKKRFSLGVYPDITPEIARTEALKLLTDIATGLNPKRKQHSGKTLKQLLNDFSDYYKDQIGATIKPRTYQGYIENIKNFQVIHGVLVSDLTFDDIEKLKQSLQKKGLSNRSVNINLTDLKKALNFGFKQGYLETIPKIERLSEQKLHKIERLSLEQVKTLIDATENENIQFYINMMVYHGLRPNEMLNLQWKDINWKKKQLTIHSDNKFKAGRTIPIAEKLYTYLHDHKKPAGYVSPYRTTSGARKVLEALGKKTDIKVTPYVLRKTFGSLMAESGQESFIIGKIMGHKSIKTTYQYYVDVETEKMRGAMGSLEI